MILNEDRAPAPVVHIFNVRVVDVLAAIYAREIDHDDLQVLRAGAAAVVNAVNEVIDEPDAWRILDRIKPGPADRRSDV